MKRALVIAAVAGLLLGACGGDGGTDESTGTSAGAITTSTVAGSTTSSSTSTTEPDDGDDPATTTSSSGTITSSSDTTTSTTEAAADERVAHTDPLEFFRSTEAVCIEHTDLVGNSPPEPERFDGARVVDMVAFRVWLIEDGMGDELLVDLEGGVVYSVDGPDHPLPIMYSFGCPSDLFVGTLSH